MQHAVFKVTTTHSSGTSQMQYNLVVHLAVFLYTLFKAGKFNFLLLFAKCLVLSLLLSSQKLNNAETGLFMLSSMIYILLLFSWFGSLPSSSLMSSHKQT